MTFLFKQQNIHLNSCFLNVKYIMLCMETIYEITKYIICSIFGISAFAGIILLVWVKKMYNYKKLFSIENQDWT